MKFFRHFGTCVNWATSMLTLWVNILEQQKTISPALILIKPFIILLINAL